jgi:molybdopterin-guanine dinucleotide biosynthesis adapter protein
MTRSLPTLGFVGSSGSGKTTLLEGVIALLSDRGVRLAVIKHAKAGFDLDPDPRKDSHRIRSAGAAQVMVASRDRWALMAEQADPLEEPSLRSMLRHLDPEQVDAVLVEGFRHERYPKIEVYRPSHGRAPQCWPDDPDVVAVASDVPLATDPIPWLDLKDVGAVATFVAHYLGLHLYDDRPFRPPVPPPSDR